MSILDNGDIYDRMDALENNVGILLESMKQDEKRFIELAERITKLENTINTILDANIGTGIAKQFEVNKALFHYFNNFEGIYEHPHNPVNAVRSALSKALK